MPDTESAASARSDRPGTNIAGDVYTGGGDFIGGDKYEIHLPQSRYERRDQRNQQVLLAKVRSFWIDGVLEKSLHRAVQLEIAKDSLPDLVGHPWDAVVELPGGQAQSLPAETQMVDLFEQSGRALLILGAPGSGKTFTLLELVRDLIERARHDPLQPIPVVLNLSTWGERGQTFAEWVVDELSTRYQVPHRTGRRWLENYDLSLMLDGLDEVDRDRRGDCVRAINEFGLALGFSGIVVCCRLAAYQELNDRLRLNAAMVLQPLTEHQIRDYLQVLGPDLAPLRRLIQSDPGLRDLAGSPLMLSVMVLALQDMAAEPAVLPAVSTAALRRKIFDSYLKRMFAGRKRGDHHSPPEMIRWLAWLARGMRAHRMAIFQMEELQPDWLDSQTEVTAYLLLSRALGGLLLGFGIGGLGFGNLPQLLYSVLVGTAAGLLMGLLAYRKFRQVGRGPAPAATQKPWRERLPLAGIVVAIPVGLVAAAVGFFQLFGIVFEDLSDELLHFRILGGLLAGGLGGLVAALFVGVLAGSIFELIFGRRLRWQQIHQDIRTVDALSWSWSQAFSGVRRGGLAGFFLGQVIGVPLGMSLADTPFESLVTIPFACCMSGLLLGVFGVMIGGFIGGLTGRTIPVKSTPNQGIWLSVRNSIIAGGVTGILAGLLINLISLPNASAGWLENMLSGLPLAFLIFLFFGMLDFIQHFVLRFFLWRRGRMPWRYDRFLDQAVDLAFLRRVGGGYIFVHRLLQDHFLNLPATEDGSVRWVRRRAS